MRIWFFQKNRSFPNFSTDFVLTAELEAGEFAAVACSVVLVVVVSPAAAAVDVVSLQSDDAFRGVR